MSKEGAAAHNEFGGSAANVAQAGYIGTVNFYNARQSRAICQVPTVPAHYTDNERQLAELDAWLTYRGERDAALPRLAIVRGSPGSGTTTLVNYWVQQHKDDYPDGQFFVRLDSGIEGPERERPALKELLQATDHGADEIPDSLEGRAGAWRAWSTGKRVAVVVDDATTSRQVSSLLPGAGASAVLVTEKGRLGGIYAVVSARAVDMAPLSAKASYALLARIVGEDRVLAEPEAVARLVALCDGLPIAVSVVAALLAERPERSIARLAGKLGDDERLLDRLSQDEGMSLTVVFDAAYQRLSELAKRCYQVLGVHPGTGDVGVAVVAAVLGEDSDDVADALSELVAAKLVQEVTEERHLMSALIRKHARSHAPNTESVERRLLGHYVQVALAAEKVVTPNRGWREQLWPDLVVAPAHGTAEGAMEWLETERVNLFAAVRMGSELGVEDAVGRLAVALWPLHERGGYSQEMVETNAISLRMTQASGADLHAAVFAFQCAFGHRQRGEFERAIECVIVGQRAADDAGSPTAQASIVELFGLVRLDQGQREDARELLRRNLWLAEQIGNDRRLALARFHLAKVALPQEALALLEQARALFASFEEDYNVGKVDLWRGLTALADSRYEDAVAILHEVQRITTQRRWHRERAQSTEALADVAIVQGDAPSARQLLHEAENLYRTHHLRAEADAVLAKLEHTN